MATDHGDSPLRKALRRALASEGDPVLALEALGDVEIATVDDARALADAVAQFAPTVARGRNFLTTEGLASPLHRLVRMFQSVTTREAYEILRADGLPHLLALFDARLRAGDDDDFDLLFLLKVASMYRAEDVVARVVAAARSAVLNEGPLWPVIFAAHDENHPYRLALLNRLRTPLPRRNAGTAYLDFANAVAREGRTHDHPYNTDEGRSRLRRWLTERDTKRFPVALSAASALPFIDRPDRDDLLGLALDHPDAAVQLEAAWAAGRVGSEAALKLLARACLDQKQSQRAVAYLTELGHGGRIPAASLEPDFRAAAELSSWLAHPSEFGRPPDSVSVTDTRELFWPPTNDRRRLWVVQYCYEATSDAPFRAGFGLVGSVTFALFGEATADLTPEDVYGLHCCWELEIKNDPRAPSPRSAATGRRLLGL